MSQYDELKRLVDRVLTDRRLCGDENHKALADGVLALIAENEELSVFGVAQRAFEETFTLRHHELIAERDELRAENAGLKTGYEAYERVNAELKAEVEALRNALRPLLAHWDDLRPGESINVDAARAALGQGEQS